MQSRQLLRVPLDVCSPGFRLFSRNPGCLPSIVFFAPAAAPPGVTSLTLTRPFRFTSPPFSIPPASPLLLSLLSGDLRAMEYPDGVGSQLLVPFVVTRQSRLTPVATILSATTPFQHQYNLLLVIRSRPPQTHLCHLTLPISASDSEMDSGNKRPRTTISAKSLETLKQVVPAPSDPLNPLIIGLSTEQQTGSPCSRAAGRRDRAGYASSSGQLENVQGISGYRGLSSIYLDLING